MSRRSDRRRTLAGLVLLVALLTLVLWQVSARRAGAAPGGALVAEPSAGAPANVFLGASPQEAPGEVWATATSAGALARYTDAGGWETVPAATDAEGNPIQFPRFPQGTGVGRTTAGGGVVVLEIGVNAEEDEVEYLVVRDPGGAPRAAPKPPASVLEPGETYLSLEGSAPLVGALEEGGQTRALLVGSDPPRAVLSFRGGAWTREPICAGFGAGPACTAPSGSFQALEIEGEGEEAWLLGREAQPGEGIELFRREAGGGPGGTPVWRQQSLGPPGSLGSRFAEAEPLGVLVSPRAQGQRLTVSGAGVWVDARLTHGGVGADATLYYDAAAGEVTGSWCDLQSPAGLCTHPLGVQLPAVDGRSFAWAPTGAGEPFGSRVVTGVGDGAILSLAGAAFERIPVAGGEAGSVRGAALSAPDAGWLGAEPPVRLTRTPEATQLQAWPVPFRRPLTAIAPEPGAPIAALGSEALAVGARGEVARYVPGQGWEPESLLTGSGRRATPTLRGVAWPEPGRAFAVGDGGAMWVWQSATGLWSPDPAAPPKLVPGNFTGIAFDPDHPSRGYAVGKQGLLLGYGRTWTQERLPAAIPAEANFTSIAFAGEDAIATWKYPDKFANAYTGGVIVNDGSGWKVDEGAEAALASFPGIVVPQRVAGLADGGAVIAALTGEVIAREGPGDSWQPTQSSEVGFPSALAAVREGGQVRAIATVAAQGLGLATDRDQVLNQPPPGQPHLITDPYPMPGDGLLLRQTATGWRDEQRQAYPLQSHEPGRTTYDRPGRPDPLLALLVSPDGSGGWAVGGVTGSFVQNRGDAIQTASVLRYGVDAAPPSNFTPAPIEAPAGSVSFAVGGNAQCAGPCADLTGTGVAPERWLRAAVGTAAGIGGLRAFLYTGPGVAQGGFEFSERLGATLEPAEFTREEEAYASRLGSSAGTLPTFAAASETDVDGAETLNSFQAAFAGFGSPFGSAPAAPGVTALSSAGAGKAYYSFTSSGNGGNVAVIVLDYSRRSLGDAQRCWLAQQLSAAGVAGTPAIVLGARDLARQAPNAAEDSAQVVPILTTGAFPAGCPASGPPAGASAYFFDFPSQNRRYSLTAAGRSVPAFGSGTLGYVSPPRVQETDFVGAGGFLLASVDVGARVAATNVAPVSVQLVPNIGSLALNALDGTLLRRSRPALFEALARRPQAGSECVGNNAPEECVTAAPDPYVPIPTECHGTRCATGIFPEYTFTSSATDIADFVSPDPASLNPRNVLLVNGKPVPNSHSGLLCAFNAGTTEVTVSTGGLSYSQKVTVLPGTVQRPCGTVPLRRGTVASPEAPPAAPPAPAPAPAPAPVLPPPPPAPLPAATPAPPPAPVPAPPPAPAPATPFLFVPTPTPAVLFVPILPPPPAPAFQPTPPSGTSPVSATQHEDEDEEAIESAHQAVAVRHPATRPVPLHLARANSADGGGLQRIVPALILMAAIGAFGAGVGGTRRRRTSRLRPAYQSTSDRRIR